MTKVPEVTDNSRFRKVPEVTNVTKVPEVTDNSRFRKVPKVTNVTLGTEHFPVVKGR